MPKTIDFASLSLIDALDLAILIEEEAKERYEEFADQMHLHHTPDAERFFRTMAVNETKHGTDLSERRFRLFPQAPRTVTREMLWERGSARLREGEGLHVGTAGHGSGPSGRDQGARLLRRRPRAHSPIQK